MRPCLLPLARLQFPLVDLDLAPFITTPSPTGSVLYDLASVVCHHGVGVDTGHYTAYCKDNEHGASRVRRVEKCGLVFLFRRTGPCAVRRRSRDRRGVALSRIVCHWVPRCADAWLLFNDEEVKTCQPQDVLNSQAYLLFYLARHT